MEGAEIETVIGCLKTLLKLSPSGIPICELNHAFTRKFGQSLNPLSLGFFSLNDFIDHITVERRLFCVENGDLLESQFAPSSPDFQQVIKDISLTGSDTKPSAKQSWQPPREHDSVEQRALNVCSQMQLESTRIDDDRLNLTNFSLPLSGQSYVVDAYSNDSNDYFENGEHVPFVNLSRLLRKGDVLEVKILSVSRPDQFCFRLMPDSDDLITYDQVLPSMTSFTQRMTYFYEKHMDEEMVKISPELHFPIEGWTVTSPYESSRTGKIEWRRALVMKRINLNDFSIFFIDYGFFATVDFRVLRKLYRPFGHVPIQCLDGILAGVIPSESSSWRPIDSHFIQKFVKNCKKGVMIAVVAKNVEQPIEERLKLLLVDPSGSESNIKNSCVNLALLKRNYAKLDPSGNRGEAMLELWHSNQTKLIKKLMQMQEKLKIRQNSY